METAIPIRRRWILAMVIGGGGLIQLDVAGLGWRTVFFVTGPVDLGLAAVALVLMAADSGGQPGRPDIPGTAVLFAGLLCAISVKLGGVGRSRHLVRPRWSPLCAWSGGPSRRAGALSASPPTPAADLNYSSERRKGSGDSPVAFECVRTQPPCWLARSPHRITERRTSMPVPDMPRDFYQPGGGSNFIQACSSSAAAAIVERSP